MKSPNLKPPRPSNFTTLSKRTIDSIDPSCLALDTWLDSQRLPGGYAGPVVHWWRDCLDYTGPGLDWRYEGIILGYLNLWANTRDERWLTKAKRAGDDLVAGQLPSGNYRNSCFELNPNTGGTPHEAACDLALLHLAEALRTNGETAWEIYADTAQHNLMAYHIERLWDATAQSFRDDPSVPSFVPNKACTLAEALFALTRFTGNSRWAEHYALPTLEIVLAHQISGGNLDGAIYQNSFGQHRIAKFFPYYIARCIPGLLEGYAWSGKAHFAEGAHRAAHFVARCQCPDGSFPQVLYPNGKLNRYPQWVAPIGDVLRALELVPELEWDIALSQNWLLAGRLADGSIRSGIGFGLATPGGRRNDPRDDIACCGWADKAFRYLTTLTSTEPLATHEP